jgi:hypothetical protein
VVSLPASLMIASFVPLFLRIRPHPQLPSPEWYLQTLAVTLPGTAAFIGARALLQKLAVGEEGKAASGSLPQTKPQGVEGDVCRLALRLSPAVGRNILALQAEDHYVRVFGSEGSDLVLMRLSDAIDELDGKEGLRIHRSWWVARSAIKGMIGRGRQKLLRLSNGVDAPVARNLVHRVKEQRWIPTLKSRDEPPA